MTDDEFFAECEAIFGPEAAAITERSVAEAPEWTPEQLIAGRRIFASFFDARPTTGLAADSILDTH